MEPSWVVTGVGLIFAAGDSPACLSAALCSGVTLISVRPDWTAELPRTAHLTPLAAAPNSKPLAAPRPPGAEGSGDRVFSELEPGADRWEGAHAALPAAAILGFNPKVYLKRKGVKDLSRTSQLACAAASCLAGGVASVPGPEIGVVFGTAWGSLKTVVDFERAAHVDGPRFVDPLLFTETVSNVPAGQVSIFNGWSAYNVTVSAGTASGLEAIRSAIGLLEEDRARIAIAGGGDELNPPLLRALLAEGRIAAAAGSFPYGENRCGPSGGEGACLLAIEDEAHALGRGAIPIGRIRASAGRFAGERPKDAAPPEAEHGQRTSPIADLIREVLDAASVGPRDVDLLVLSGSGDLNGDAEEARAVVEVFGSGTAAPAVVAPKGILGETWAASGPFALVTALEAIRTQIVPPLPHGARIAREAAGLNFPTEPVPRRVKTALILDCAGNGHLSGLIVAAV